MRIVISTIILSVFVIILGAGCAGKKIILTKIPHYQKLEKSYNTSAVCHVNTELLQNSSKTRQFKNMFIDALRKNKYKVVDIEGLSTKRVRGQVDKMILLAVYNKRSIFLPVKKQAAFDLNIVLAITDISKTKAKKHTLRYFTSWGRSIVPCDYEGKKDGAVFMKKNYTKATLQAINHLFYIDAFRKTLEPID